MAKIEFDVLTLFPNMFTSALGESMVKRAIERELITVRLHQIRDFTTDKHHTTDDLPYGGGAGMVMKCEPLYAAWEAAKKLSATPAYTVLLSPAGKPLKQNWLENAAATHQRFILICGRYEGVDARFIEECVDEEVSLGDFILSGGEIPAMALIDGLMRLIPGALGNETSTSDESFSSLTGGLLEYPQYTRPPEFHGRKVPDILLSGDHAKIAAWRKQKALERTRERRPELLDS
jgi:tRNA (guanine37-N1)-methyltransferase